MSHGDPQKWNMPGWRIEQKYSNGVRIGNWGEDRFTFQRDPTNLCHNSTHRTDFKLYGSYRPDVNIRRKAQFKHEGMGKENLFYHHGKRYSNNCISWYDEQFNKRERDEANKLPELRSWDSHSLAWQPEKSDYPIQGASTNFGLRQKLEKKWRDQIADETKGDYITNYQRSHTWTPKESLETLRYANARELSTTLHPYNRVNTDLNLRSQSVVKQPEIMAGQWTQAIPTAAV